MTEQTIEPQSEPETNIGDKVAKYAIAAVLCLFVAMGIYILCHSGTDSKFVGQWCYCKPGEASEDSNTDQPKHCIASIKKVDETSDSYLFNMSFIFTLKETFTKQDDNTLIGIGGSGMTLKYIDSTGHILLTSKDDSNPMEFSKLK